MKKALRLKEKYGFTRSFSLIRFTKIEIELKFLQLQTTSAEESNCCIPKISSFETADCLTH